MLRRPGLLLIVLAALAALVPVAQASARKVPAGFFGVTGDGPLIDGTVDLQSEMNRMHKSGVETIRVVFDWAAAQPRAGEEPNFRQSDRYVVAASLAGLRVLPVLSHAPDWAARRPGEYGSEPKSPKAFAGFVASLVRRYGPKGTLTKGFGTTPIRQWQIWNEPSLPYFWSGRPWPKTYVKLLRTTRKAIKRNDKGAKIILAGLTNGAAESAWVAMRKLYKAGARGLFDAVSVHPYTAKAGGVIETVRRTRAVMRKHRDGKVPMLITETSWSSSGGLVKTKSVTWDGSEAYQAASLRKVMKAILKNRKRLRIKGVCWYTWLSPQTRDKAWSLYAGLNRMQNGSIVVKPALRAFSKLALPLEGR